MTTTDTQHDDDVALLADAVRNFGKMVVAIDRLTSTFLELQTDITIRVQYDDRIARALESIADTLARLERT